MLLQLLIIETLYHFTSIKEFALYLREAGNIIHILQGPSFTKYFSMCLFLSM